MKIIALTLASIFYLGLASDAHAFSPQPGLWIIDSEDNGKPSRGLQIDRQEGNTIIVSYFGYRPNGSATFYQSTGTLDQSIFKGRLIEYKNGRALGEAAATGEVSQSIGGMELHFSSESTGEIKLPGETPQSISRYVFEDHRRRLNGQFRVTATVWSSTGEGPLIQQGILRMKVKSDRLYYDIIYDDGSACGFNGDLKRNGVKFKSQGSFACETSLPSGKVDNLSVDQNGLLTGLLNDNIFIFGMCFQKDSDENFVRCEVK